VVVYGSSVVFWCSRWVVTPEVLTGPMELEDLATAIDDLVATDPSTYADRESIVTLEVLAHRLDAFRTEALASLDASGEWEEDGARSAAAWLAVQARLPKVETSRRCRRGRSLRGLPVCREAFLAGDIGPDHVDAIGRLENDRTQEALIRDEALLVQHARTLTYPQFRQALAYWLQLADPDGTEDAAERQRTRRDVSLHQSFSGTWLGEINLDPISGSIVADELRRLEFALFCQDWEEASGRLGRKPSVTELCRTPAHRRADALVEMASRSLAGPKGVRPPRPLFTVHVDYPTVSGRICELANGTVITPGSLLPWLTRADIERAVFCSPTRVEVSATSRLFTGATRRAIEIRDRTCSHPYCDEVAEYCQVDHVQEWRNGGPTTQDNGRLLCRFHNLLRNLERPPPSRASG
jgi:hypothetical protein